MTFNSLSNHPSLGVLCWVLQLALSFSLFPEGSAVWILSHCSLSICIAHRQTAMGFRRGFGYFTCDNFYYSQCIYTESHMGLLLGGKARVKMSRAITSENLKSQTNIMSGKTDIASSNPLSHFLFRTHPTFQETLETINKHSNHYWNFKENISAHACTKHFLSLLYSFYLTFLLLFFLCFLSPLFLSFCSRDNTYNNQCSNATIIIFFEKSPQFKKNNGGGRMQS